MRRCAAILMVLIAANAPSCLARDSRACVVGFHGGGDKLGAFDGAGLEPARVSTASFGKLWASARFDDAVVAGTNYAGRAYASPLFLGGNHAKVLVATSSARVYALSASDGAILWQRRLTEPAFVPRLDGGIALGVLSTPIVDLSPNPSRVYVASLDAALGWLVFALELDTGRVLDGWPVRIDDAALAAVNTNAPARFQTATEVSQRGALALSPFGDRLYVPFGSFAFASVGWLVAIDTRTPRVASAFSTAPDVLARSNGGIWGSGGAAIDRDGHVWVATGNSPPGTGPAPRTWGNSVLELSWDLRLLGTYTPFNYCKLDEHNIDLAGSAPLLIRAGDGLPSSTPNLLTIGGKQGNVYLIDRDAMDRRLDRRPPCSADPRDDRSLHPHEAQPQFGARGPLNVFGPYSDEFGQLDFAKARTRPAFWPAPERIGPSILATGTTRVAADSNVSIPPSIVRLLLVRPRGAPAFLSIAARNLEVAMKNPGPPLVTHARDGGDAVVWVLDENALRTTPLVDPDVPSPILYAFDAATLDLLWRSEEGSLRGGGKYNTVAVGEGIVYVATERLTAFGAR
jgi:outer membrane protein assembly factor BamB